MISLYLQSCTVTTVYNVQYMYSQTCLFWTPWDPKNCPDYTGVGVLISQVHLCTFTCILQWELWDHD